MSIIQAASFSFSESAENAYNVQVAQHHGISSSDDTRTESSLASNESADGMTILIKKLGLGSQGLLT